MILREWIKNKILKKQGVERLSEDPNSARLTFISDADNIKIEEIQANKVWYLGDGNELLNFYTQRQAIGFANNPIYNRNKRNYFWSLSAEECQIKRVHSGVPNMIITTLTNIIGMPDIKCDGWDEIAEANDFKNKLTQQARPLTMAEGFGAWKINFNTKLCNQPLWEYYEGEFVEYIYKAGILIGIVFKSYYQKDNKNYVLLETRYRAAGNSYVVYELFELRKSNEVIPVDKSILPELGDLKNIVIPNYNNMLAVPSRYFYDPLNPKYGKSIYAGKLDLFDMLDEIWSQASQTNRVSTPVEYYNPDIIGRGPNGMPSLPNLYNRQFVMKSGIPDGEGNLNKDIDTTQPDLNFDKYGGLAKDILDYILTGILSPATLGIDISRKDNAEAQREKEKVSIMTRNNIIAAETIMLRQMVKLSLDLKQYLTTGQIIEQEYEIDVKYNEFANPSFENQIQILGSAWVNGELSTAKYVDLLWGDKLDDEAKLAEIQWLEDNKEKINEDSMGFDLSAMANKEETPEESENEIPGDNLQEDVRQAANI